MAGLQKAAIVTGASGGMGSAVAERLASDGFALLLNYSGNSAPAEELATRIRGAGGRAIAFKADIAQSQAVTAMLEAAEEAFGGADVLVNAAGVNEARAPR